jgi:hypothetical protein
MNNGMCRTLLTLAILIGASMPAAACSIVYGSDWAFASETPKNWESACGNSAMEGTSITLWPAKESPSNASALIYVTVSDKDPAGLAAFAEDEQAKFKRSSPASSVSQLSAPPETHKFKYVLARYNHASGNREELVAYMEGPNVYYIIVLTAKSEAVLATYRSAFLEYVEGFIPMERK